MTRGFPSHNLERVVISTTCHERQFDDGILDFSLRLPIEERIAAWYKLAFQTAGWSTRGVFWPYDLDGIRRWMQAHRGEHSEDLLWSAVDPIHCPTLLIRAAYSDVVAPEMARAFQAKMPAVRVVEIPNVGHRVFHDNFADYFDELTSFLTSLGDL